MYPLIPVSILYATKHELTRTFSSNRATKRRSEQLGEDSGNVPTIGEGERPAWCGEDCSGTFDERCIGV